MTQEYGPQYYIRILTADNEINPTNVLSISTQKDIYADSGSWSVTLNYDQQFTNKGVQNTVTYSQNSVFFKIKPMDYVEIYLAEQLPRTGFGIYDEDGYDRPFNTDAVTKEKKGDDETAYDLGIVERYLNPHLVFCGFVDAIDNNFSVGESSASNTVTLRGRCLSKFLIVHHLFFNFPYAELLTRKVTGQIALNGLRPNEAIDLVLTDYLIGILSDKKLIDVGETVSRKGGTSVKSKTTEKVAPHEVHWLNLAQEGLQSFVKVIHNDDPSFRYLYWGTDIKSAVKAKVPQAELVGEAASKNGYFPWGRMEYINTTNRNILNITADSPVFQILKQSAQIPFNEFFVDEFGGIVLRKALTAWDYTDGSIDTQPANALIKNWVELIESDIISWNFSISDDELKTLILSVPIASILKKMPTMAGAVGMSPVTETIIKAYAKLADSQFEKQTAILTKKQGTAKNVKNIAPLRENFAAVLTQIKEKQTNHMDGYSLSTREQILKFWTRFGVRPLSINDLYSLDFVDVYISAYTLFQKYANYWWKGTFTVRGHQKYKIGQKGVIKKFAQDLNWDIRDFNFYIHTVAHNFTWGEGWTTQITFTRGQIDGTYTSQNIQVSEIQQQNIDTGKQETVVTEKGKEKKAQKTVPVSSPSPVFSTKRAIQGPW